MNENPETEERPYIEQPDIKDDDVRNGLICWMDGNRECGPDCMAFVKPSSTSATWPLNAQQLNCFWLTSAEKMVRYIGGAAKLATDITRQKFPMPRTPKGD